MAISYENYQTKRGVYIRRVNLAERAHVPFGQHQDTDLWNNQFPESKISEVPLSRRMRALAYMASGENVDVDVFHKGIQYALEKNYENGNLASKEQQYQILKAKDTGSGDEIVDYSRAPCLTKRHAGSGNEIGKEFKSKE